VGAGQAGTWRRRAASVVKEIGGRHVRPKEEEMDLVLEWGESQLVWGPIVDLVVDEVEGGHQPSLVQHPKQDAHTKVEQEPDANEIFVGFTIPSGNHIFAIKERHEARQREQEPGLLVRSRGQPEQTQDDTAPHK
jgi:hypothetical protein